MARKTKLFNEHEFTKQIHSSKRADTIWANMPNHDEKKAKSENKLCCHDCRYYLLSCKGYIGRFHKPCDEFEWWQMEKLNNSIDNRMVKQYGLSEDETYDYIERMGMKMTDPNLNMLVEAHRVAKEIKEGRVNEQKDI